MLYNFSRRQIAFKSHSSGSTKIATHFTTNLINFKLVNRGTLPLVLVFSPRKMLHVTWDDMHKVDLGPPGRGFPLYFPKLLSYLIITASTKPPFWQSITTQAEIHY